MTRTMDKTILIWGAGKIGRGFVAEAFHAGGYQIVFADADKSLVADLNREQSYTLVKAAPAPDGEAGPPAGAAPPTGTAAPAASRGPEIVTIDGYSAYHLSESERLQDLVASVPVIAVAVFPSVFASLADTLATGITARAGSSNPRPLDILVCANTRGAAEQFREMLHERISPAGERAVAYLEESIGVIDTVIMRIAIPTPEGYAGYGPLTVTTNGYPTMPVDARAFRGPIPEVPILRPIETIEAEETRKFFTHNMAHAVFAYAGTMAGATTILEAAALSAVVAEVEGALAESAAALQSAFGYSDAEMSEWNASVLRNLTNPLLEDTLARLGADPIRKLGHNDRLVGAAVLCKRQGKLPWYLTRAIARAFFFDSAGDPSVATLQQKLAADGILGAIREVAGLEKDPELVSMVADHFRRLQDGRAAGDTPERVAALRTAYEQGFFYEKKYHGCAQCALASMFDVSRDSDPGLFQAASAMAGGVGLTGDGICGGYAAGVLWMGRHVGRRLENFGADKAEQYQSFEMTQKLRDRYMETYGSITCRHIHESIFDRAYILTTKAVRNEFEEAGGHEDRCTSVVAMASMWTTEVLMDEGFLDPAVAAAASLANHTTERGAV
jgi:mannitol-1-phosphate 5-dehydrogenase